MGLTNNDILKKLRVALKMRDDEIIHVLSLVDFEISKSELGAFFRSEDHPKYMDLQDQILRKFLNGLIILKEGQEKRGLRKIRVSHCRKGKCLIPRGPLRSSFFQNRFLHALSRIQRLRMAAT